MILTIMIMIRRSSFTSLVAQAEEGRARTK